MKNLTNLRLNLFYIFLFILMVLFVPVKSHGGDMSFWNGWANNIFQFGLGNIYRTDANYHPIFLFILWFYGKFQSSVQDIENNIYLLKIFPLVLDFAILIPIYYCCKKFNINYIKSLFLMANVAYFYNSYLWGQIDSVHTNLVISSIILLLLNKPYWSACLFILALNTKMQAIFFLPIIGLLYLVNGSIKKIGISILLVVVIEIIILIPFILSQTLINFMNVVTGSVDFYPVISMNAHNFWYWIFPYHADLMGINDYNPFIGSLTYKSFGTILFLLFSALILFPLLWKVYTKQLNMNSRKNWEMIFLISTLIPLVFFFFNTQMHERYSHPIIITSFIYGLLSNKFDLYILSSIAYFMNMEKILKYFNLQYQTLIFEPRFISLFFLSVLVIGLYRLYRVSFIPNNDAKLLPVD